MNKLLLTTLGLVATLSALAQGTFNANNNFTVPGAPTKAMVTSGGVGVGATARVEVLYNGLVISPVGIGTPGGAGNAFSVLPGIFSLGVTAVPGVAGGTGLSVPILVRAWDSASGATYDAATTKGFQAITLTALASGANPPQGLGAISNFSGFELVPEPSTIALATLGLAGLFFVARRKQ